MTFYINSLELANTNVLKRTSSNSWGVVGKSAKHIPCVEQTGQKPTNFSLDMDLVGDGRFDMITSMRAELYNCRTILVKSTNRNLYGNQKEIWLAHASLNEKEDTGKKLDVKLSGVIDPYIIHSCDFDTGWTKTNYDTVAADTTQKRTGNASIKGYKNNPGSTTSYAIKYTPTNNFDFSKNNYIGLWFRLSTTDIIYSGTQGFRLYTSATVYSVWNLSSFDVDTWTFMEVDLANPDYTSGGGVDLADVDYLNIMLTTDASPPASLSLWVEDIRVR